MEHRGHKGKIAEMMFALFAAIVLVISALTSFSFFYTHFGTLVPAGLLDSTVSRVISGVVGMTLFDVATAIWLFTFLHHSETPEQRAVSLTMTMVAFVGASAASIAYLGLNATGDLALGAATRETIGLAALITVIAGVIMNFGAAQLHSRFSLASKLAVREADRRDVIQMAEDEQAKYLDSLVAKNVKEELARMAPDLAQRQARRLAGKFYDREDAKYDGAPGTHRDHPPERDTREVSPTEMDVAPDFGDEHPELTRERYRIVDANQTLSPANRVPTNSDRPHKET